MVSFGEEALIARQCVGGQLATKPQPSVGLAQMAWPYGTLIAPLLHHRACCSKKKKRKKRSREQEKKKRKEKDRKKERKNTLEV